MFEIGGKDVASFILAVLLVAALVAAARRERLLTTLAVLLTVLAASWAAAAIAVRADYRDADGFVDCWPYCSTFQDVIGGTLVYGPVAMLALLVTAGGLLVRTRRRSSRSSWSMKPVTACDGLSRRVPHPCPGAGLAAAAGLRRTLIVVKVVGGFLGLLLGAFLGMIGLFLILYTGDQGNEQDIYVSFWDAPRIDADFIGVPLVVIALALVAVSLRALRRGGIP